MCRSFVFGLYLALSCFLSVAYGQQQYEPSGKPIPWGQQPEIGKPMPDFTLDNITHYKTTSASLKDFRGKWLVLDFWETGCLPCIKKFPEISQFQERFKDQIQFILVGAADNSSDNLKWNQMPAMIRLYERLREKKKLNIASAYDSVLYGRWGPFSFPQMYIINPSGILMYITGGRDMTEEKLQQMIDGKTPPFYPKEINRISMVDEQDTSILFQSKLSKFDYQSYSFPPIDIELKRMQAVFDYKPTGYYQVTGAPLAYLYKTAYIGQAIWFKALDSVLFSEYYPNPVLKIEDKTPFVYSEDGKELKGLYNYYLKIPAGKLSKEYLMSVMQGDLKNYFGFTVSIEQRQMPVWKLISKPSAKKLLETKGGEQYFRDEGASGGPTGIIWRNVPGNRLINVVGRFLGDENKQPYLDETGIDYNIDISLDADMSDREQVRKELQKYGLDLVKGTKEYKTIVVRD